MLKRWTPWITLSTAVFLLSGIPALPLLAQNSVSTLPGQTQMIERVLTVSGQGNERIPATLAEVSLGVEAQATTAAEAQSQVAQQATRVVNFLKSKSVERLQTTSVNLRPNYRYDKGKQTLVGYVASTTVSFRMPVEKMTGLLDEGVQAGATRIDRLSFTATDEELKQAQKRALKQATQDAQVQADAVLDALNLSRQEIIGIQINGASAPPPMLKAMPAARMDAMAESAAVPIESGEQEINASVTLQIRY